MKRIIAVLLAAVLLCGTAAFAGETDSYWATGGWIKDQQTYSGSWQQAYRQILNNHSGAIHTYQYRTLQNYSPTLVQVLCKPVAIMDVTADGIPELIFMEAVKAPNGNLRGDLYIYSSNGSSAKCVLYVPGITRIGYDDIGLGFDIYLTSANGGTLAVEYYEYEWPWVLQLTRNALGSYTALNVLRAEYDASGEGSDRYYRNGMQVSVNDYDYTLQAMRNGMTMIISTYYSAGGSSYGFAMDWESAVNMLGGSAGPTAAPATAKPAGTIYGLTINRLATRTGPGTQYTEGGTYNVKGQYIQVLARAYDKRNGIWWVKCVIPYHGENRILWTGYKRFDHSQLPLESIPIEEGW